MKIKKSRLKLIFAGLLFSVASFAYAVDVPPFSGFVNDTAGMLTTEQRASLESDLTALEKETGNEIAILTIPNIAGDSLEDFAVRVMKTWGVGKKDVNNGVLFLVTRDERRMRIEVGYGLEPYITDGTAGWILDTYAVPDIKAGNFADGILKTVPAIEQVIRDGGAPVGATKTSSSPQISFDLVVFILFFGLNILFGVLRFLAKSESFWHGGVLGAVLGVLLGLFLGSFYIYAISGAILGIILDFFLSRTGNSSIWKDKGRGGGFWGGGFGGGGGGGFGGFGGGFSGGGGASR